MGPKPPRQDRPKQPVPEPEPKAPELQAAPGNAGEFKIDRGGGSQGHVVHIDRDGNLSFSENEE